MYELENEITHWKQAIVSNGVISSEELTELESHLRESIAALREKGLTAQEAFMSVSYTHLTLPTNREV